MASLNAVLPDSVLYRTPPTSFTPCVELCACLWLQVRLSMSCTMSFVLQAVCISHPLTQVGVVQGLCPHSHSHAPSVSIPIPILMPPSFSISIPILMPPLFQSPSSILMFPFFTPPYHFHSHNPTPASCPHFHFHCLLHLMCSESRQMIYALE